MLKRNIVMLIALVFGAAFFVAAGCSSDKKAEGNTAQTEATKAPPGNVVVADLANPKPGMDPVCGMKIDASAVTYTMDDGKTYGFCSNHCADQFKADPDKYLAMASSDEEDHSGHNH